MPFVIILISFGLGVFLGVKYFGQILDFVAEKSNGRGVINGSWKTHLGVGRKETKKIEKAAIARVGLGASDSDETIYWNAFSDNHGDELYSSNNYKIIFKSQPKVRFEEKGFWSLTVYGNDKFLVPNEDYKYLVRSDSKLEKDEDGSFTILLSRSKPENPNNWLPIPENDEKFSLALRCYRADDEMKTNSESNKLPVIVKI